MTPSTQSWRFFHYSPKDDNFYHVTCNVLQGSDDHDYDHGFFYDDSTANYYVTCKLFSHSLILNLLNKNIYGMDINVNNFKQQGSLSLNQRFNLEQDLK